MASKANRELPFFCRKKSAGKKKKGTTNMADNAQASLNGVSPAFPMDILFLRVKFRLDTTIAWFLENFLIVWWASQVA